MSDWATLPVQDSKDVLQESQLQRNTNWKRSQTQEGKVKEKSTVSKLRIKAVQKEKLDYPGLGHALYHRSGVHAILGENLTPVGC